MFFPIRDTIPAHRVPVVNYALIAACSAIFLYQVVLPHTALNAFVDRYGMAPAHLLGQEGGTLAGRLATLVTCMFLHGGWLHLLGNMLYLYIFGDNVEDRLGHAGYVVFYLACGIVGSLLQVLVSPDSGVHTIGASGAIAGVLGAYVVFYPHARVVALVFIIILIQAVEVPAFLFLGFWFVLQLFQGVGSLGSDGGGVAWWAHVGGFVAGAALAWHVRSRHPGRPAPPRRFPF